MTPAGFSHSEIHGSSGQVPLTVAYRSLSRPSSASCAKASTVCPYHLLFDGSNILVNEMRSFEEESSSRYAALKVRRGVPRGPDTARSRATRLTVSWDGRGVRLMSSLEEVILPRKEVIQPHLPVRLPCYDFTPLTNHTFGASLPRGLGRRLRVQSTRVV